MSEEPVEERAVVVVPCRIALELTCPTCGAVYSVPASIGVRVVQSDTGEGSLGPRLKAERVAHLCRQLTLQLEPSAG